jgi:hypothetical protein
VLRRMSSSGMWRYVDLALTDVSEERIASIFMTETPVYIYLSTVYVCRLILPSFLFGYILVKLSLCLTN